MTEEGQLFIFKAKMIPKSTPEWHHSLTFQLPRKHPQKRRNFYSMDKTQTIYLLVFRNKDMSSFPENFVI